MEMNAKTENTEMTELDIQETGVEPVPDGKMSVSAKKRFGNDRGVAVVEIILILVVLIALVVLFRDQITALANTIWRAINGDAHELL